MNSGRVVEAASGQRFFTSPASSEASDYLSGKIVI
jgi:ABC-type phosphate transport system ATPase subunit